MELLKSLYEVGWFLLLIVAGVGVLEGYFYTHFRFYDRKWFFPVLLSVVPLLFWGIFGNMLGGHTFALWLYFLLAEGLIAAFFRYIVKGQHTVPYMLIAPAFVGLALLLVYPFVFEFYLSFHDLKLTTIIVSA